MEANLKVGIISWESKHFYSGFRPRTPKDYQTHSEKWALFFILPQLPKGGNGGKTPLLPAPLSGQVTCWGEGDGWAEKLLRAGEPGLVQPAVCFCTACERESVFTSS